MVITMPHTARFGTVIFTGDKDRLVRFYEAVAAMGISVSDAEVTVLTSDAFELVIHTLRDEPASVHSLPGRESYVKPFFPVASLSETRQRAAALGGRLSPADEEWEARGFRACEAIDPDGNPIQFRESAR
jgi:predicted enzyme related to lactoylglutathione lyase